ncbi:MAG: hypothetical protein OSA05_10445, partial [Nitrospinaceae bacterium]|nr:hypothetical protein [Nitrospinaceae bacterium]
DEAWPINTSPVTITEAMIEPKAEEKTNSSVGLVKSKRHTFLMTAFPTLRNASMIRRKRMASI